MNYTKKILLLVIILIGMLLLIPNICNAASFSVSDEATLRDAISKLSSSEANTITLTKSITISDPLPDITKDVTINGDGFTISGDENWYNSKKNGNQSIITSTEGTLILKNIILKHGPKQGAQAYGNGTLILDGVTISDCKYTGLIANGGKIEIRDLNLYTNAGIEVGKSTTNQATTNPNIVMNGTLKTISKVLIYEDPTTKSPLTIINEEGSKNKLFITNDSIFITDSNNAIIYETKNNGNIEINNPDMAEENFVTVNINYNELSKKLVVTKNDTLSKYDLSDVKNIEGKVFANFVKGDNEIFSEDTPITEDIELTAVYKEQETQSPSNPEEETQSPNNPEETPSLNNQKDQTPKTGNQSYLRLALVTLAISILSIIALKRKF